MSPLKKPDTIHKKAAGDWSEKQTRLSTPDFECSARTHIGYIRSSNQDRYVMRAFPDGSALLVIADGLGGDGAGDLASETIRARIAGLNAIPSGQETQTLTALALALDESICRAGKDAEDLHGMGSTLIMALVRENRVFWVHIGDSRLYLFQHSRLIRITTDQTLVRFLIAENALSPEEAPHHYSRHVMDQYVGCGFCEPESGSFAIVSGDWIVLMSDGVYRYLSEAALTAIFEKPDGPDHKCRNIIQAVLAGGGKDNLTILAFHRRQEHTT
jgi:protein phosphatase